MIDLANLGSNKFVGGDTHTYISGRVGDLSVLKLNSKFICACISIITRR